MQSCRDVNECLGLFRELVGFDNKYPFAAVAISSNPGQNISTFVSSEKQYYILLYVDFLLRLEQAIHQYSPSKKATEILEMKGDAYVRRKLIKYALFFITLHEYAHVLNGDCDCLQEAESVSERAKKEKLADEFADKYLNWIIIYQYRLLTPKECYEYSKEDRVIQMEAKSIALSMRIL